MTHNYSLLRNGETQFITVFVPCSKPLTATDDHPNFKAIVSAAVDGDPNIADLFDVATTVARRFEPITGRVSVANGRIYLDGDEIDNSITRQIIRFLDDGEDFEPLALFFEKVQSNPDERSREQLYDFLRASDFTIDYYGDIIAYKGVYGSLADGYRSVNSGSAIVNGEPKRGNIPQTFGDVVEMPRSKVHNDPSVACSTGLHVAAWDYASTWTNVDAVLAVAVNPRDVVSVPRDHSAQKVRVCRYTVLDEVGEPFESALLK